MITLEQIQDLETSRKGYLISPTTNLDYDTSTANSFKGTVLYDDDPNLITFTSTQSGAGYLGKLLLWQLPVGTHYTSPALVAEYIKVLRPLQSIPIHNATIIIEGITYTFKNVLSTPAVSNEILISSYSMDKCWKKISLNSDTALQTNITNETQARIDGDTALQASIDAIDITALQTNITNETQARIDGDTALQSSIGDVNTALDLLLSIQL